MVANAPNFSALWQYDLLDERNVTSGRIGSVLQKMDWEFLPPHIIEKICHYAANDIASRIPNVWLRNIRDYSLVCPNWHKEGLIMNLL